MVSKYIVSALVAASTAYAASCGGSDPTTVQNQGDADKIATCPSFKGDITINPQAGTTLDFGTTLKNISGKVSMDSDSQLATLSFNSLTSLGSLSLTNLTALTGLNFGALTTVGDMDLVNLPALSSFNFGTGLEEAGRVTVENVQISDLSGISSASKIDSVILSNCQYLSNITFTVTEVGTIDIGPNNYQQGQQIDLPQLKTATLLTFRNSSSVNTPMLHTVSDTLSLIGNTFQSYGASNLSWVDALVLNSNPDVTNFTFPSLTNINGTNSTLNLENNTALTSINGFPKLSSISGDALFAGNLKNITLPKLTNIGGAITVDTTSSTFDCDSINNLGNTQVVKGAVTCKEADATPVGSSGTSTGSDSSSSSKSAASIDLPSFLTTGAFAAVLAFLA